MFLLLVERIASRFTTLRSRPLIPLSAPALLFMLVRPCPLSLSHCHVRRGDLLSRSDLVPQFIVLQCLSVSFAVRFLQVYAINFTTPSLDRSQHAHPRHVQHALHSRSVFEPSPNCWPQNRPSNARADPVRLRNTGIQPQSRQHLRLVVALPHLPPVSISPIQLHPSPCR